MFGARLSFGQEEENTMIALLATSFMTATRVEPWPAAFPADLPRTRAGRFRLWLRRKFR